MGWTTPASAQGVAQGEDLLFMELPMVISASKRLEPLHKTPAVSYVVTEEEIKNSGARTVAEILKRVPGMYISVRETSLIGSRGFTSDMNDKFVFLIDNVPVTNLVQDGVYSLVDMPILYMVERIEVIKGPGSTLWGSDATFGIINIITKNGEDINGVHASTEFSTRDKLAVTNVLYGNKLESGEGDYFYSLTVTDSDGAAWKSGEGNSIYSWGAERDTLNTGIEPGGDGTNYVRQLDLNPSFEMYGKVRTGDTTFKARMSYISMEYLWKTIYGVKYTDARMKHFLAEVEHVDYFSGDQTLTSKVNIHTMDYERGVPNGASDPTAVADMETSTETGIGAELTYNATVADINHVLVGVRLNATQVGPTTKDQYYVDSGMQDPSYTNNSIMMDRKDDVTTGIYLEDKIDITDALSVVAGVSAETNSLRDTENPIMPRFALIYQVNDALTAKYTYNTGYQRPPALKKFGRQFGHVEKSEKTEEQSVQLMYMKGKTRASITGFTFEIEDYFTWVDYYSGAVHVQGHGNQGTGQGYGVETDLRYRLLPKLDLYANAGYAYTTVKDELLVGEPRFVYNLGFDWDINEKTTFNLNTNGWYKMYAGVANFEEQYFRGIDNPMVDMALRMEELFVSDLSLTLYATNVFDQKIPVGMTGWPGYTYRPGVSVGTRVTYKW